MDEEKQEKALTKKEAIYTLGGKLITARDEIKDTDMFDLLAVELDDYTDLEFTEPEARKIKSHIMNMRHGLSAMAPIYCGGPAKCPYRERCPLKGLPTRKYPLMRQCILERDFIIHKRFEYIEELDVNVESPTEMALINRLVEIDIYDYRASLILAMGDNKQEGQDLLKEQITGISPVGDEIKQLVPHPAFDIKERLQRQRMELLRDLVATRREKYKKRAALKEKGEDDHSIKEAKLAEKLKAQFAEGSSMPSREEIVIEEEK